MSDIALLAHLAPFSGGAPSGPTVRRALDLAGAPAMLGRIARARAKARERAWELIQVVACISAAHRSSFHVRSRSSAAGE
jgi:hypothetical protein